MIPQEVIPQSGVAKWLVFYPDQSATTTNSWKSWIKPDGCSMVFMLMIAAGGGGGKGAGAAAIVASGGGGSGGITRLLIPAFLLPNTFYIRPGNGGLGAASSTGGVAGTQSYISMQPNTTTANIIITQAGGGGGGGAATSTAGAAGAIAGFITLDRTQTVDQAIGLRSVVVGGDVEIAADHRELLLRIDAGDGVGFGRAGELNAARGEWRQAANRAQHRALARARFADDAEAVAGGDLERHVIDGDEAVEDDTQMLQ